jgi:hypothetical protein
MASNSVTTGITRAILALVSAIDEIDDALIVLAGSQDQQFRDHVTASREARNQCLEEIQSLLILMDRDRE